MGIPSLNSAILYCVSLYFHIVISSEFERSESCKNAVVRFMHRMMIFKAEYYRTSKGTSVTVPFLSETLMVSDS